MQAALAVPAPVIEAAGSAHAPGGGQYGGSLHGSLDGYHWHPGSALQLASSEWYQQLTIVPCVALQPSAPRTKMNVRIM